MLWNTAFTGTGHQDETNSSLVGISGKKTKKTITDQTFIKVKKKNQVKFLKIQP